MTEPPDASAGQAESDAGLLLRLVRTRADSGLLASALPPPTVQRGLLTWLCLFCLGVLTWVLVMPLVLTGWGVGLLIDLGSVAAYLALRPSVKRTGWFSAGSFTVTRGGVFRALSGIGQARRRIRKGGDDRSPRSNCAAAVVFLLVVLGLPTVLIMVTGLPEVLLGWIVLAMLALNECVLLVIRTLVDTRTRSAAAVDAHFGQSLIYDYLRRGGEVRRLTEGIPLTELAPPDEKTFRSVMGEGIRARARTRSMWQDGT